MKKQIEEILKNCYTNFGEFDESKATKELLDLFSVSKPLPNDNGKPPKTDAEWDAMCNRIANENK